MTAGRTINANKKDCCTPLKYVDAVRDFLGEIELDPCSNEHSLVKAKIEYIFPQNDGLRETWNFKTIYVNPPYGIDKENNTSIKDWIARCDEVHEKNDSEVLALIPVAVNTRHWKQHIFGKANQVCFLADTRLRFVNSTNDKGAPMACAMVYWGHQDSQFYEKFSGFGVVVNLRPLKQKKWVSPDLRKNQMPLLAKRDRLCERSDAISRPQRKSNAFVGVMTNHLNKRELWVQLVKKSPTILLGDMSRVKRFILTTSRLRKMS